MPVEKKRRLWSLCQAIPIQTLDLEKPFDRNACASKLEKFGSQLGLSSKVPLLLRCAPPPWWGGKNASTESNQYFEI